VISIIEESKSVNKEEKNEIIEFLYTHLGKYGDPKQAIEKAINFMLKKGNGLGGKIILSKDGQIINGAVVINYTGMQDYIPENILVYIATHQDYRGQGIGKTLMQETIKATEGDIALHVEADNPAVKLYEKVGFTKPYLEMRYKSHS